MHDEYDDVAHGADEDGPPNKIHDDLYLSDDRRTAFDVDPETGERRIWREFGGKWNGPYGPGA